MPALFDVPGWSVQSALVSTQRHSKKRKRAAGSEEQELLRAAQANLDQLIGSLGGDDASGESPKKRSKIKSASRRDQHAKPLHPPEKSHKRASGHPSTTSNKNPKEKPLKHVAQSTNESKHPVAVRDVGIVGGLTSLQQSLRKSLDGARFRMLNETLYKSSSADTVKMIREDPQIFEDYHIGFRRQVQSWPSNPVSYYVSKLSSYPTKTVIADMGCGDAALAQALLPKNFVVLSFDLVSDGAYVIEADICSHVPLPGTEPRSTEPTQGEAQVVDVAVCALSLMSTNWPKCISEAWRILKPGGELMIAEVASRFSSVEQFTSLISSIGFKLQKKDDRNSHFTLFQFKKVERGVISEEAWSALVSNGRILKPCEYKRR